MSGLILEGDFYRNFIESVSSKYTRESYNHALKRFMSFCGVNDVNDLFFQADAKYTQSRIIDFLKFLKDKNQLSPRSRILILAALKHFYDMNDFSSLNWKKIRRFVGEIYVTVKDRPYTHEEIEKLLEKANEREKVIVLLMSSTGMRQGAIHSLKLSNLQKIEKYNIYKITVYERTKEEYFTFCTPECAATIDNYLEFRKRYGETLKPTSPLIREEFNKLDPFHAAKPRFISTEAIDRICHKLVNDSGLRENEKMEANRLVTNIEDNKKKYMRYEVMTSHGLRKFFETESVNGGMSPLYASIFLGHSNGLEGKYFKPSENDLLEGNDRMTGYIGVMDFLTINPENRLKRQVQELTIKASEMDQLRNEIDQIKLLLGK
jgi:integrase